MKSTLIALFSACSLSFSVSKSFSQVAANIQDSLALVDLYDSTNGPHWASHNNWLTTAPLSTWEGVGLTDGRVENLDLSFHNLTGNIPSSIGDLLELRRL